MRLKALLFVQEMLINKVFSFEVTRRGPTLSAVVFQSMEDSAAACRICFGHGSEGDPLYQPCLCSGTIKYVHSTCLATWQATSVGPGKESCELCGAKFRYRYLNVDWSAVVGCFCSAMNTMTSYIFLPLASTGLLTFAVGLYSSGHVVKLQLSLTDWFVGVVSYAHFVVAVFLFLAIVEPDLGGPEPLEPEGDRPLYQRHFQRMVKHHCNRFFRFLVQWLLLMMMCGIGWVLRTVLGWTLPSSVVTPAWLSVSTFQNNPWMGAAAQAVFAGLTTAQQERATTCLAELTVNYWSCVVACALWLLIVFLRRWVPLTLTTAGPTVETVIKISLQCAPFFAMWCTTQAVQETSGVNHMLGDCYGVNLSALKWVLPLWFAPSLYLVIGGCARRLSPHAYARWQCLWEEYANVHRSTYAVCQNVLIASAVLAPFYLAMVFVPLRYGHYLCPLASTTVRTLLRADGSTAQVVVPQLLTLMSILRNPFLVDPSTLSAVFVYLTRTMAPDSWLHTPGPGTEPQPAVTERSVWQQLSVTSRATTAYVLWLSFLAVWTSWSVHAPYWLGTCLLRAPLTAADGAELPPAMGVVTVGTVAYQVGFRVVRAVVEIVTQRERALGGLSLGRGVYVLWTLVACAMPPLYLCGTLVRLVALGIAWEERVHLTWVYPDPVLLVLCLGILGMVALYAGLSILSLTGVIAKPSIVLAAELSFALGFAHFQFELAVRCVAVPLTLMLLEVLVTGYFLLRAGAAMLCESGPTAAATESGVVVGDVDKYQCTVSVVQRGPLVLLLATVTLLCVRAVLRACLPRMLPDVRTRVLLNRE